jgi:hypothetical protein
MRVGCERLHAALARARAPACSGATAAGATEHPPTPLPPRPGCRILLHPAEPPDGAAQGAVLRPLQQPVPGERPAAAAATLARGRSAAVPSCARPSCLCGPACLAGVTHPHTHGHRGAGDWLGRPMVTRLLCCARSAGVGAVRAAGAARRVRLRCQQLEMNPLGGRVQACRRGRAAWRPRGVQQGRLRRVRRPRDNLHAWDRWGARAGQPCGSRGIVPPWLHNSTCNCTRTPAWLSIQSQALFCQTKQRGLLGPAQPAAQRLYHQSTLHASHGPQPGGVHADHVTMNATFASCELRRCCPRAAAATRPCACRRPPSDPDPPRSRHHTAVRPSRRPTSQSGQRCHANNPLCKRASRPARAQTLLSQTR